VRRQFEEGTTGTIAEIPTAPPPPPPGKPWRPIFDGKSAACIKNSGWRYENASIEYIAGTDDAAQPRDSFGDVELRIRFDKLPGRPLAPNQVVPRARELLAAGDTTGALSVLYVGTLGALVLLDAVDVPAQATEGECLRRVGAAPIAPVRRELFQELTARWQLSAYAHVVPEPDQVHGLCERFTACFGAPA
jgi:hypothetical protein